MRLYSNPKNSTASLREIMMQIHKDKIIRETKQIGEFLLKAAVIISIVVFIMVSWSVLCN